MSERFLLKDGELIPAGRKHVCQYPGYSLTCCIICGGEREVKPNPFEGWTMPITRTDVSNKHALILRGEGIYFPQALPIEMDRMDAIILAAWIVRLLDRGGDEFSLFIRYSEINKYSVMMKGGGVFFPLPIVKAGDDLRRASAFNLAAWIIKVTQRPDEFARVLNIIRNEKKT